MGKSPTDSSNSLLTRVLGIVQMSPSDRKTILAELHPEVKSGLIAIGGMALEGIYKQFSENRTPLPEQFERKCEPTVVSAAGDGYLTFLAEQQVDPLATPLREVKATEGLGETFLVSQERDRLSSYLQQIDPETGLILTAVYELRSNQIIAEFPRLIELPYRVIESMNQHLRWVVYTGFVVGIIEKELTRGQPTHSRTTA